MDLRGFRHHHHHHISTHRMMNKGRGVFLEQGQRCNGGIYRAHEEMHFITEVGRVGREWRVTYSMGGATEVIEKVRLLRGQD